MPCVFSAFLMSRLAKAFASWVIQRFVHPNKPENFSFPLLFNSWGKTMKTLLLITLVAGGLVFASAPRSDAQVYFSVGFGPGYYGYYPYGYYYPYRYY